MAVRDYFIWGESIVYVKASSFKDANELTTAMELGLSDTPISISIRTTHRDIYVDDFGPSVPAEVLCTMSDAIITMSLVHFNYNTVLACLALSMGSDTGLSNFFSFNPAINDPIENTTLTGDPPGTCGPAGRPMGVGIDIGDPAQSEGLPNNNYIRLYIASGKPALINQVWRFKYCYLMDKQEIPLGTERSLIKLTWRALPYRDIKFPTFSGEAISRGAVLWDNSPDDLAGLLFN